MKLRQRLVELAAVLGILTLTGCNACTEQHNPRPDQERFQQEQDLGNAPKKTLNDDGSLPKVEEVKEESAGAAVASQDNAGVKKYQQFCVACHGANGAADGPAAMAMNPKPRNLTDPAWQDSVDDARIAKVIKEGGAAVGLSATMAPWGAVVSDEEIEQMVAYIRSMKK
ncbi:c-type cytochrome [Pseudobacteriovorax antillogorgiicola]|uniref:Cytochrome C oxidase, cbb3-type, subunit III n=1 Tax=Pseudobacteriovorax antillogorgiicola TaxID=1513793 RepID=A0A1Y6CHV6_9BACT|nr:cytochrome c [Pseudobacteriovorax antillogorgiicola]TCS46667.1 cbb3-type cytochrome c oxidase subunit III [Pseudobacteriovorax antillogorgiicola]SMF66571.1 Cytochrome C oxidase, cbb3-type, subunit III [Pseudobacteriovorax antillogorgiicola]